MPTDFHFPDNAARTAEAAETEKLEINLGPSHPSTHGVLRIKLELDGEVVTKADPVVGYLHRGDEKIAENMTYNQFVPYTDRLDYLAPLANNAAYAIAVERLAGLELPPAGQALRVIICELARISSHLMGLGAFAMDCGAWTIFMYTFEEREKLYTLFEELTGARFTTSYTRIGGFSRDHLPEGWLDRVSDFCDQFMPILDESLAMLTGNRIWRDRTEGVGVISRADAIAWGLTGPNLRASGVALDLRKDKPYLGYEQYDFDVPVGATGDSFDRYLVRGEEMKQSVRIVKQAVAKFPGGPLNAVAPKILAPKKDKVLTSMEELIQNFMIVTEGPQIPAGEVYFEAENPKGALGFYIVSKGGGVPWRMKIRSPSFCNLSILPKVCVGSMLGDVVSILGSLDFVMGECDR